MLALRCTEDDMTIFWPTTAEKAGFLYSSDRYLHNGKTPQIWKEILGLRVNLSDCQDQDISIKMLISPHPCFNYLKQLEFKDCGSVNWQIFLLIFLPEKWWRDRKDSSWDLPSTPSFWNLISQCYLMNWGDETQEFGPTCFWIVSGVRSMRNRHTF